MIYYFDTKLQKEIKESKDKISQLHASNENLLHTRNETNVIMSNQRDTIDSLVLDINEANLMISQQRDTISEQRNIIQQLTPGPPDIMKDIDQDTYLLDFTSLGRKRLVNTDKTVKFVCKYIKQHKLKGRVNDVVERAADNAITIFRITITTECGKWKKSDCGGILSSLIHQGISSFI